MSAPFECVGAVGLRERIHIRLQSNIRLELSTRRLCNSQTSECEACLKDRILLLLSHMSQATAILRSRPREERAEFGRRMEAHSDTCNYIQVVVRSWLSPIT